MKLFSKKGKSSVGLDIGSSLIKIVEIDHSKEQPVLSKYGIIKLPSEAIVEGEIMDRSLVIEGINECATKAGIKQSNINTAVSGRAVIVKKVVMDKMNPDDAKEAIFWEAEQHVPFDIDDVCLDFQILKEDVGANQMEILLVAAKKEMVTTHADLIREAGFNPVIIDVDSFAIQNAYEVTRAGTENIVTGLINIGSETTNINIVQNNIPHFTRDLSIGSNVFLESMQRDMGIGLEEAEAILHEEEEIEDTEKCRKVIAVASEELSMGIERSISFLKTAGDAEQIDEVILSGGGARLPWLREILSEKHGIEFKVNDAVARMDRAENMSEEDAIELEKVGPLLTVSMGLALRREEK
ncbi:MAG: type IV pilus assembly protein PilM [Candidatus Latescibacteria bacterium]|nr:type IV pilus assembly protein PilM [Candidatus Latescibacterota bacterium]NIM21001.1 type IV pilus assembly protein PilM [Candidatus Latescibacterota bacterium]NIM65136.1 type IV pilus assembly protein PilM [Candidatus Latescibacterota bacterium]NIO01651.1 type IV pilus assembly protein PilM [Candidatus Latescibacterota bacterium]NIO28168.1 type IV pilus assembly protein PilM [Candidatus Latescibacterota bacterium]